MGVEPTLAASAAPINGFEDRGAHRDSTTPTMTAVVIGYTIFTI